MNIKDLDLNLLVVFSAIYKEENISRAAERLELSQPATSNALARLRKILDDPLFIRSGHGVIPTARSHALAEPIERALGLIQTSITEKPDFNYGASTRSFELAMSDYSEFLILPKLIEWVDEAAPGLRFNVWPVDGADIPDAFSRRKIDLAIGNIPFLHDNFRRQRLFDEDFVAIVRQGHPLAKESITEEEFVSYPHIAFTPRSNRGARIDQLLKERNLKRLVALQIPNYLSMAPLVAKSDYIAPMPFRIAQAFRDTFPIKIIKLPLPFKAVTISQFWHEQMHNDPGLRWLRALLFQLCQRI